MTCFVIAFAVRRYLGHVNREFANADRIYVLEERNVAPGDDTAALFSPSASLNLGKLLPNDRRGLGVAPDRKQLTLLGSTRRIALVCC
jgi:hypothetical protein